MGDWDSGKGVRREGSISCPHPVRAGPLELATSPNEVVWGVMASAEGRRPRADYCTALGTGGSELHAVWFFA